MNDKCLTDRTAEELDRLNKLYESLEPISGLERDFMMRVKKQRDLIADLYNALSDAIQDNLVLSTGKADLVQKLRKIHNAALPDPHDERDISLDWLVDLILKETRGV